MRIERVRVPLGVIGVIYESRPNVTADAGALASRPAMPSSCVAVPTASVPRAPSMRRSQRALPTPACRATAIQLVPTRDRDAVGAMLHGLDGAIDVIVPRGGKGLVARVQSEARLPVFAHLDGNCHVYVDAGRRSRDGGVDRAQSKMRRTGVCGAAETLLVDRAAAPAQLAPLVRHADRGRLRGPRRPRHAGGRSAGQAGDARRTGAPNISTPSSR